MIIYDVIAVCFAYFGALWLRFDLKYSMIPDYYLQPWARFAPFYALFCIIVFKYCKLYKSIWRYASFKELQRVLIATIITTVFHTVMITILLARMPVSYYVIGAFFQFILIVGMRFSYRFVLLLRSLSRANDANNCMFETRQELAQMAPEEIRKALRRGTAK